MVLGGFFILLTVSMFILLASQPINRFTFNGYPTILPRNSSGQVFFKKDLEPNR